MARRSLRPHLNQIRTWVRQGRTDAWVAHQLEVTVQQIEAFKKENDLLPDGESPRTRRGRLRRRDRPARRGRRADRRRARGRGRPQGRGGRGRGRAGRRRRRRRRAQAPSRPPRRPRPRAHRRQKAPAYEGTFDHGDEGYGLWLDPAIADDGIYAEHWAGHRQVEVTVEADQIVIKRVGDATPTPTTTTRADARPGAPLERAFAFERAMHGAVGRDDHRRVGPGVPVARASTAATTATCSGPSTTPAG